MLPTNPGLASAVDDFRRARQKAAMEQLLSRVTGRSTDLLAYEDVVRKLQIKNQSAKGLQDIPLDAIVGSVGRYQDYTRTFLPKHDSDEGRWSRVKTAMLDMTGVPPIEVYKIGDSYFVKDGNHRVSIAREMGSKTIAAYVTEVETRVPLSPTDDPDAIISKARYANFLTETKLDRTRTNADLEMRFCGQYGVLLEHIEVHRYFMGLDFQREFTLEEAATHWYDMVYRPVVNEIGRLGVMRHFPDLLPADLYVLVAEHRAEVESGLGWTADTVDVVEDLVVTRSSQTEKKLSRAGWRMRDRVTPDELETGPAPGTWRAKAERQQRARLFSDILVAARGVESDLRMLEHAAEIARREQGRLLGLHVVPPGEFSREEILASPHMAEINARFNDFCNAAGVPGTAALEIGEIPRVIVGRAAWSDLVVLHLAHPPGSGPLEQLGSGFTTIIHRSPCPILAVPTDARSAMDHFLLAYDGSDKAREALYVGAYAARAWNSRLTVASVGAPAVARKQLDGARVYLEEQQVAASYVHDSGAVANVLVTLAEENACDLLLLGGFGAHPLRQMLVGSTVLGILRSATLPILICR